MTAIKPEGDEELRAELSSADTNDLPDSDFAYIEPGGEKDAEGKTTPRSLRHFPIQDKAHVQNALARLSQSPFGDKAKAKVVAAAKKFGIEVADDTQKNADGEESETRAKCPTCKGSGTIMDGNRDCPDCDGSGTVDGDSVPDGSRASSHQRVTRRKDRARKVPLSTELRHFTADNVEIRDNGGSGDTVTLTGKPIVYNVDYEVHDLYGAFTERMIPGVMTDVLSRGDLDCRMLINHEGIPLARTTAGTLTLNDGPDALGFTATLDLRQQIANDIVIAIQRFDVTSMSVGMQVGRDVWSDDMQHRDIHSLSNLLDISPVTFPASGTTSIEIAQRMAAMMPLESSARARKFYVDSRAGKKMSASNANMVLEALHTLHTALGEAGAAVDLPEASPMDPDGSVGQDGDAGNGETNADALTPESGTESTVTPVGSDGPGEPQYMDDGSQGALSGSEGYPGFADGSGLRAAPASKDERAEAQKDDPIYRALVDGGAGDGDVWVHSTDDGVVVYELYGEDRGLYRLPFSLDDAVVVFDGDAERVMVRTEFVPVSRDSGTTEPASVVVERVSVRSSNALRLALEARKRRR